MPVIPVDNEVPPSVQVKPSSSNKQLARAVLFLALIYVDVYFEAKTKPIQILNVERRPSNCNSKSLVMGNDSAKLFVSFL